MGKPYRECQYCGAHLDAGEICDCGERERERPAADPRRMRLVAICREVDPETGNVAVYQVGEEMNDRTKCWYG